MIDQDLLDKFFRGECHEAEVQHILRVFNKRQTGEKHIEEFWHNYLADKTSSLSDTERRLAAIQNQTGFSQPKPSSTYFNSWSQWVRVAAILTVAFILPLLLIKNEPSPNIITTQYIIKENPAGRKSTVQLPDGSVARLNAESQITFLENFNDSIRKVSLVGEAFFEVVQDKEKPFIVSSLGVDTYALGTSFNINAYENDQQVQVVLASGQVKINLSQAPLNEEIFLSPGEEVHVEKGTHVISKHNADLYSTLAWKDNVIVFDQAPAAQVFATLERWFGVSITLTSKLPEDSWSFTGEFRNENLENILESISYIKDFSYQINQKTIFITP